MEGVIVDRDYKATAIACEGMNRMADCVQNNALSHIVNRDIGGSGIDPVDIPELKTELIREMKRTLKQLEEI